MKFLTVDASKSINPNTGESWYRAEVKVSVDDSEVPEEVFKGLKERLDSWLPNPFETTSVSQVSKLTETATTGPTQTDIDSINACTTLEGYNGLLSFKKLAETYPDIRKAYEEKLKSFQHEKD